MVVLFGVDWATFPMRSLVGVDSLPGVLTTDRVALRPLYLPECSFICKVYKKRHVRANPTWNWDAVDPRTCLILGLAGESATAALKPTYCMTTERVQGGNLQ